MSQNASMPVDVHVPDEPFGQRGVRQYAGRVLTAALLISMVTAGAMWYRSHQVIDSFSYRKGDVQWIVNSIYGRLIVLRVEPVRSWTAEGLQYQTSPLSGPMRNDAWTDSLWKRVGVQWGRGHPNYSPEETGGVWWLRLRWPLVMALTAAVPIVAVLRDPSQLRIRALKVRKSA